MSNNNYALSTWHAIAGRLFNLTTDAEVVIKWERMLQFDIRHGWSNPQYVKDTRRYLREAKAIFRHGGES